MKFEHCINRSWWCKNHNIADIMSHDLQIFLCFIFYFWLFDFFPGLAILDLSNRIHLRKAAYRHHMVHRPLSANMRMTSLCGKQVRLYPPPFSYTEQRKERNFLMFFISLLCFKSQFIFEAFLSCLHFFFFFFLLKIC